MTRIAVLSTAHIHSRGFMTKLNELLPGGAYAVWDDNQERGQAYADEFETTFVADLDQLISDEQVDGFIITAENTRHLPLLRKAIPAGKPILCEKPLTTTVEEAQEIAALVEQYQTPLTSGYFNPFNAGSKGVAQALADNAVGKVTHISHRNCHHAAYGRWFDSPELAWFADKELAGGGALLDLGTHSIHFVRTLFGPVEEVFATITNLSGNYDTVDDYGLILLRFANGVIGRVEAGWCNQGGPGGLEVFGSEKTIWWSDGAYRIAAPGQDRAEVDKGEAEPATVERIIAMAKGELSEASWRADLECCLDAVLIMAAAYKSAEQGSWVQVAKRTAPAAT